MKLAIIGLGIQGKKRKKIAGKEVVFTVDPINPDADYRSLDKAPWGEVDCAFVCTPDSAKIEIAQLLLSRGIPFLVEKPFMASDLSSLESIQKLAAKNQTLYYTAYNHRFEPHIKSMRDFVREERLGKINLVKMYYGNGTARDVFQSQWRDSGYGVWGDLGPHLLDTYHFLFDQKFKEMEVVSCQRFENRAPDYVLIKNEEGPLVLMEMSLHSYRNHFSLDIYGEQGSAHISGLCKWGPSEFIWRKRKFPSGKPDEEKKTFEMPDPTWKLEMEHFRKLIAKNETQMAYQTDHWICQIIQEVGEQF